MVIRNLVKFCTILKSDSLVPRLPTQPFVTCNWMSCHGGGLGN